MKTQIIALSTIVAATGFAFGQSQALPKANVLSDCEVAEGFKLLFDGTNIQSFRDNFTTYAKGVTDNSAQISNNFRYSATDSSITSSGNDGDIRSKTQYKNFDLRIQYRNDGNQGVFYRFNTNEFSAWETGIETAIEDNVNIAEQKVSAGAVYDMFAPAKKVYNAFSSNKWNDLRIVAIDSTVEHWMNGERIISFKYHTAAWWAAYETSKWKGFPGYCVKVKGDRNSGPIMEGYIGFQGNHGGKWRLRSVRINSTAGKIKFGADCNMQGVGLKPEVKPAYSAQRSGHTVNLRLAEVKADRLSLLGLDGREVLRSAVDASGSASLSGWGKPGVYLLHATQAGHTVLRDKIYLQ